MERLYKYTGNISSHSISKTPSGITNMDMMVDDLWDRDKAPARLQAWGEMAEYLDELFNTDREEKYLQKDIFFDELLTVKYVVIRALEKDPDAAYPIPAKVIATSPQPVLPDVITVFGDQEFIDTCKPMPMTRDEWGRFLDWKRDNELYGLKI